MPLSAIQATADCDDARLVVSTLGGLQCDRRRNVIQLVVVLSAASCGYAVGSFVSVEKMDVAAEYGAVFGMIVGTMISRLALRRLPPPPNTLTLSQFKRKYRSLKLRVIFAAIGQAVAYISLAIILALPAERHTDFAGSMSLICFAAAVFLCIYCKLAAQRLSQCECPSCGEPLGAITSKCPNCALSLYAPLKT